jgi:hypothetical protein
VAEAREPEQRHLREDLALAGIGSPMITSKARKPVARDHEDAVVADGVVVAHLAARQQRQAL